MRRYFWKVIHENEILNARNVICPFYFWILFGFLYFPFFKYFILFDIEYYGV